MRHKCAYAIAAVALSVAVSLASLGCGGGGETVETVPREPLTSPRTSATVPDVDGSSKVQVFFVKAEQAMPVERAGRGAKAALEELLGGPSGSEKTAGFTSAIPAGTRLLSYEASGSTAKADFSSVLKNYGGGSMNVQLIIEQITRTVTANDPGVRAVEITVEGVPAEEALQP